MKTNEISRSVTFREFKGDKLLTVKPIKQSTGTSANMIVEVYKNNVTGKYESGNVIASLTRKLADASSQEVLNWLRTSNLNAVYFVGSELPCICESSINRTVADDMVL